MNECAHDGVAAQQVEVALTTHSVCEMRIWWYSNHRFICQYYRQWQGWSGLIIDHPSLSVHAEQTQTRDSDILIGIKTFSESVKDLTMICVLHAQQDPRLVC